MTIPARNPNAPSTRNATPVSPATPLPKNIEFPKVPSFHPATSGPKTKNFQRSQALTPTHAALPPRVKLKIPMQLEKVYEPGRFEPRWAQWWVESGIYHAQWQPGKPVFSLVIPPPNVTGVLHMGHMLEHSEIDVTVRWHRMRGDITLWLPGTDHAGIATEMVVARQLAAEGIHYRRDLAREAIRENASGNGKPNPAAPSSAR